MPTEAELIMRIKLGDEAAFETLYKRLAGNIYTLALHLLGNREDAEEVLQDTFVNLHKSAHRFNPKLGSARAYLYTIARNEARMRLRAKRSRPVNAEIDVVMLGITETSHKQDDRLVLNRLLDRLHKEDADLLRACFFEGYSHTELAKKTGIPLGTLKSRMRRALLKLRELWGVT